MKKVNVTLKDISEICGVSRQTVSRVLNNEKYVKAETRKLILETIKKYNYKPNLYARNLSGGSNNKSKNILLSLKTDLSSSAGIWLNLLVNSIISMNKYENVSIIIEEYGDKKKGVKRSLLNTTNSFIDGVIIFYEDKNDDRIKTLKKSRIPYIVYGKAYNEKDICVGLDNENSMIRATEYLFSKGLENIAFLSAFSTPVNLAREEGIKKAYEKNNVDLDKLNIIKDITNIQEVYDKTKELYETNNLPQVIFVSGDEKAIGALNALAELGIKVPEEVSVMGYDNIPISKFFTPSLSTINFDYMEISKSILEKILNMIDGKKEESKYFKGELIIRGSTK